MLCERRECYKVQHARRLCKQVQPGASPGQREIDG